MRFLLFNALVIVALFHLFASDDGALRARVDALAGKAQTAVENAIDRHLPAGAARDPAEPQAKTTAAQPHASTGSGNAGNAAKAATGSKVAAKGDATTSEPNSPADAGAKRPDPTRVDTTERTRSAPDTRERNQAGEAQASAQGPRTDAPDRQAKGTSDGAADAAATTAPADRRADAGTGATASGPAAEAADAPAEPAGTRTDGNDNATAASRARSADSGTGTDSSAASAQPSAQGQNAGRDVALAEGEEVMSAEKRRKELFNLAQEMEMMFVDNLED